MLPAQMIKHCRACGAPASYAIPENDNRPRAICSVCATVHYENPLVVVGTLPVLDEKVLLCKRNIEPRYGLWTLPAGFMELCETTEQGALRETVEESGAQVELQGLYTLLNVVRAGQVHLFYRARMLSPELNPGPETIEARLFAEDEVPWDEIAFRTTRETLRRYFADRPSGRYPLHCGDIA